MAQEKCWSPIMKINLKAIVFLMVAALATSVFANPAQEFNARLDKLGSFQAQFNQRVTNGKGRLLQQSQGSIAIARPGKFRWESKTPMHQLIIADGQNIWIYDVDLKQVTVKYLRNANNDNPALFLSGFGSKASRYFHIEQSGDEFTLTPNRKGTDFQEIFFAFNGDTLTRMRLTDSLGQRSDLQFTQVRMNQSIPPSTFMMRVPHGVDVIRPSL